MSLVLRIIIVVITLHYSTLYAADFLPAKQLGSFSYGGFNLYTAHLSKKDIDVLASTKAKVARFHLETRRSPSSEEYSIAIQDLDRLDRIVALAATKDLRIVIALDPVPRAEKADFWDNEVREQSIIQIWKTLANKYRGNPYVAAYDLINESHAPKLGIFAASPEVRWRKFAEQIITTIRSTGDAHPVVFEPTPIALPGAFDHLEPVNDENVVYSFHFYEPHRLTHQGILGFPVGVVYPGVVQGRGYWDKNRLSEYLEPVRRFVRKYKVPVQVGEFSCIRWAPSGTRNRYLKDFLDLVKAEDWGWLYHSFREWDGWDLEVDSSDPTVQRRMNNSSDFELIKSYLK